MKFSFYLGDFGFIFCQEYIARVVRDCQKPFGGIQVKTAMLLYPPALTLSVGSLRRLFSAAARA